VQESSVSLAFVFPGQGSHRAGALAPWQGHPSMAVLDEVSAGVGRDVLALSEDPTAGARTADAQPAIMAASLVTWRALTDAGISPSVVAGHSLGEYTAAIAAGVLGVEDGARLVATRGAAMGEACAANPGTMAAVVKLHPDAVTVLVEGIDGLVVANDNAPGQVVVAGTPDAVAAVKDQAREAGGRALPLDVEGAFHSPAMEPAVEPVREAIAGLELADPVVPLVAGASARPLEDAAAIGDALVAGMLSPVRWREVQLQLETMGVTDLVEVGPGGVLAGLAKRTVPGLTVHTVSGPEDLDAVVDTLSALSPVR
jgi:[acyl-carrier-protein] S-malonyltransferase